MASLCDRINIMYGGKIVETGTDREIFYSPNHPYTKEMCIRDSHITTLDHGINTETQNEYVLTHLYSGMFRKDCLLYTSGPPAPADTGWWAAT